MSKCLGHAILASLLSHSEGLLKDASVNSNDSEGKVLLAFLTCVAAGEGKSKSPAERQLSDLKVDPFTASK